PGRGDEARQIRGSSPSQADDDIRASEVGLAEDLPAKRRDFHPLACFSIRDLREQGLVLPAQVLAKLGRPGPQRRRVDDEHLAGVRADRLWQVGEHAPPDDDVVVLCSARSAHGDCRGHLLVASLADSALAHSAISPAITVIGRTEVSQIRDASDSYTAERTSTRPCQAASRSWGSPAPRRGRRCPWIRFATASAFTVSKATRWAPSNRLVSSFITAPPPSDTTASVVSACDTTSRSRRRNSASPRLLNNSAIGPCSATITLSVSMNSLWRYLATFFPMRDLPAAGGPINTT